VIPEAEMRVRDGCSYEVPRVGAEFRMVTTPGPKLFELLTLADILDRPSPPCLVRGLIRHGELVVIFGDPSTGKTFVALDLVMCIAAGIDWWGHPVAQGPVLYLAGEGVGGLGKRVRAWADGHDVELRALDVRVLPEAVAIIDGTQFEKVHATIESLERKPAVIVIDTLARYLIGGDENSALDTGKFLERCTALGAAAGATVVIIHHKRKGAAVERGSSAIRGAADVMWEVTHDGEVTTIVGSKAKDGELMPALYLKRKVVWLGTDEDDEPVSSLRFERGEAAEPKVKRKEKAKAVSVVESEDEKGDDGQQLRETLAKVFGGRASGGALKRASGLKQNRHYDALKRVIADGTVCRLDDSRFPEYELTDKAPEYVAPPPASLSSSLGEFANSNSNSTEATPSESSELELEFAGPRKGAATRKLKLDQRGRKKADGDPAKQKAIAGRSSAMRAAVRPPHPERQPCKMADEQVELEPRAHDGGGEA